MEFGEEHIGRRVIYTGRNGNSRTGVIQGYAHSMVNLKLDDSTREVFYVPMDTVKLIPDTLQDTL